MRDGAEQDAADRPYGWSNAQVMAQFNGDPLPQMQQSDYGCETEMNPADAG